MGLSRYTFYRYKAAVIAYPRGGCRPLHRIFRVGPSHLGCQHWKPMAWIRDLFYFDFRPRLAAFPACHVFWATEKTPPFRRLDDLGENTYGMGIGRNGGSFYPASFPWPRGNHTIVDPSFKTAV